MCTWLARGGAFASGFDLGTEVRLRLGGAGPMRRALPRPRRAPRRRNSNGLSRCRACAIRHSRRACRRNGSEHKKRVLRWPVAAPRVCALAPRPIAHCGTRSGARADNLAHRPTDHGPAGPSRSNCGSSAGSPRIASTAPPSRRPDQDSASTISWPPIFTSAHRSRSVGFTNAAPRCAFTDKPKVSNFGLPQMGDLQLPPTARRALSPAH